MIFDSHSHTEFSADSSMTAIEAMDAAEALGLGLVITEHLDIGFPGEKPFDFEPEEYFAKYAKLRGEKLALGVEVGLTESNFEDNLAFIARGSFDLVIGSLHVLNGRDLYYPETYAGLEKEAVYRRYLTNMAALVREHRYIDVLGHIDYIARYAPYADGELDYPTYAVEIDDVFAAALETDTVPELNTRRLGSDRALDSLAMIYRRYRELGGKFVTLGSDAHQKKAVGANFDRAKKIAADAGLKIVTFVGRQMKECG